MKVTTPGTRVRRQYVADLKAENARLEGNLAVTDKLWREEKAEVARLQDRVKEMEGELAIFGAAIDIRWEDEGGVLAELAEVRGKLEALQEDAKKARDAGPSKDDQWWIDRILRGSKEGNNG